MTNIGNGIIDIRQYVHEKHMHNVTDCVFCRIAEGREHAFKIYEDESIMVFLDKYPLSPGHTLVATRKHFENILTTPGTLLSKMIVAVKAVASAQINILNADGVKIIQNNGSIVGQEIFHVHFHVIPYYHKIPLRHPRRIISEEEGNHISNKLREYIQEIL
ncbi:MAG: HIT domain-containing protein [Thermoproteales archaeon]|nr:HIT domain-containing protein [Thermoproteales archaeon]